MVSQPSQYFRRLERERSSDHTKRKTASATWIDVKLSIVSEGRENTEHGLARSSSSTVVLCS